MIKGDDSKRSLLFFGVGDVIQNTGQAQAAFEELHFHHRRPVGNVIITYHGTLGGLFLDVAGNVVSVVGPVVDIA